MKTALCSLALGLLTAITSYAATTDYVFCQDSNKKEKLIFVKQTVRKTTVYAGLVNNEYSGLVPADDCFSYRSAPKEIKDNIANPKNVVAICYYITSNDGSGELGILRKSDKGVTGELKTLVLDMPNLDKGQELSCY